jgi:hypothetical protein
MKSLRAIIFFSSSAENPLSRKDELQSVRDLILLTYLSEDSVFAVLMNPDFADEREVAIFQKPGGVF